MHWIPLTAYLMSIQNEERPVEPGDWLNSLTSEQRKRIPLGTMLQKYFPDALAYIAYVCWEGNNKHNPGQPIHWAREKSTDHHDCIARHLANAGSYDGPCLHSGGLAWRALAALQLELEAMYSRGEAIIPEEFE